MKRNWDLIRAILIHIENQPELGATVMARQFPEFTADEVNYHIWLLIQAELIIGICNRDSPMQSGFVCKASVLTWQGQEFLSQIRQDSRWQKIRTKLTDKSIDLSFDAIKAAASWLLMQP